MLTKDGNLEYGLLGPLEVRHGQCLVPVRGRREQAVLGMLLLAVQDCTAALDEQRMSALEECLDLELALGLHREITGELQALAREFPLRERVWGQLMLALYRSGRQAEALDAYLRLAKRLAGDLGVAPAADIARLHAAILRQDPSLDLPPEPAGRSRRRSSRPPTAVHLPVEAKGRPVDGERTGRGPLRGC